MVERSFQQEIEAICIKDPRYAADAYYFLRESLDYTSKALAREQRASNQPRHVTGQELCQGVREYALQEFGPLASLVLTTWGLHTTADIGEIVYNLIETGKLGKSEQDRKSDFTSVYDFEDAFVKPYAIDQPLTPVRSKRKKIED